MIRTASIALLTGLIFSVPAARSAAHHSFAGEFDPDKPITFKGTIKKVEWMNPHIYTQVEVTELDGKVVVYRVEGGPPNMLYRQGWRKDDLKIGEVVTVSGLRARSLTSMNVGQATITTSDGRQIFATGGGRGQQTPPR